MTLEIIYQDNDLVAIHKPSGLLVHRSHIDPHDNKNAMHLLRDQLGQWVYPVHRLDKPTSGVLLFALSAEIARSMCEQFEAGEVNKIYQAVVRGYLFESCVIDHPLKSIADFKQHKKTLSQVEAKESITEFRCLAKMELPVCIDKYPTSRYSLVELNPKTGRKHQLRRHMKHISHPIIGDPKYGKSKHNNFFVQMFACRRLLLAATDLEFVHPVNLTNIAIHCPLQDDFKSVSTYFS